VEKAVYIQVVMELPAVLVAVAVLHCLRHGREVRETLLQ
jgi:hypothetical protein